MGLVIPAEVGRLEGGVGVAVEHETGTADGQQDALVAGKAGETPCFLDGGRAQPIVKVELVQGRTRGIRIWAVVPCLFFQGIFNWSDSLIRVITMAPRREGESGASDTISGVAHKAPPAQATLVGHKSGSGPP